MFYMFLVVVFFDGVGYQQLDLFFVFMLQLEDVYQLVDYQDGVDGQQQLVVYGSGFSCKQSYGLFCVDVVSQYIVKVLDGVDL